MSQSFSGGHAGRYQARMRWRIGVLALVLLLVGTSFAVDLATGPGDFPLRVVWDVLLHGDADNPGREVAIRDYRLPIAAMAVLIGAMLATAGAQMQTLLDNPLAEPFTLGIASAASFGAAVAIVSGNPLGLPLYLSTSIMAFLFALATCVCILVLAQMRGLGQQSIVLFGIAVYFVFNALLALMQYNADQNQLQQIVFWMMGSLTRADPPKIAIAAIALALALIISLRLSWQLTALRLGEDSARTMGIAVRRLQVIMLILISLLAGLSVAFVGAVGFVGLVGPHIARLLLGEDQRFFIPLAALIGALMMSVTSIASKSITPGILYPIGMITALIGVPVFISIIFTRRSRT